MGDSKIYGDYSNRLPHSSRWVKVFSLLVLFVWASGIHAQTPGRVHSRLGIRHEIRRQLKRGRDDH
jgi:hypothetical protein